ncbi:hypothetical protein ACWGRK_12120 [Saccharomonospora azurea]|uniref:Lipoprotein n=1 Tax=Saccharomonospora azurea NA-128 TaxID=882081 RepID=H8G932_9PSEU|nr:hypothetical protein [Saccharomonospora azurea]EHK84870.1 hypothetical protein SZMC14600_17425 [Saccharomonospora azurea SZMC 14600]EHY90513.1 hypothetical protein SacazDRAFT_03649 [Saccharomonospora azurea NA-128]
MSRTVVVVLALVTAVLTGLLTGCGGGGGPEEPSPSRPPATTPQQPEPSKPGPPGPSEVTVRGTVQRGVEPNCLVLTVEGRQYLLLEAGGQVRPGVEATVHGTTRPNLATTCMQGTPLVVDRVEDVEGGPS